MIERVTLLQGDCKEVMKSLPAESVHCVVTSIPYWGLRDYGLPPVTWEDGTTCCLGLEPTPGAFIAHTVEVFREVRRVLRKDGTLWLNIGDSYAASGPGSVGSSAKSTLTTGSKKGAWAPGNTVQAVPRAGGLPEGLKPKDLTGMPWRVALALQQPYVDHAIRSEAHRAWLAGLVDGEGCICSQVVESASAQNESHSVRLQIRMADVDAVEHVVRITRLNSVTYDQNPPSAANKGRRPAQQWKVSGDNCARLLADIYPYLTVKRKQAIVAWNLQRLRDGITTKRGQPIPQENMEKRRLLHEVLRRLNQRQPADIPSWCVEPKVHVEPGWYLRCDCVWSKANPMPESVRDRPTRSHEFVFLLAKSERYYYDADAVRERTGTEADPAEYAAICEGNGGWTGPDATGAMARQRREGKFTGTHPAGRNLRSVWHLPTQPYAEAHFACVDAETEALTPNGWRKHGDLKDGDLIAEYDPNSHTWKWAMATFHRYDYDGELVVIEKRGTSQRLTPNHRCLVRRRSGVTAVVRADEVRPCCDVPLAAPGSWTGSSGIGEDWAALVGWFIAEGHVHKRGGVTIYQSETANPQHVETIRRLLASCGVPFKEHRNRRVRNGKPSTCIGFYIGTEASQRLLELAPEKKLTPELTWLPERECRALLGALIAGDGHTRADGRSCIIQKDAECIELMQLLAMRLGYRAIVAKRGTVHALYLTRGAWLTLRGTNGKHTPITHEQYLGVVWCPSVPTGFWIARRNGRPFITGNTYPERLVEPCVKAGTSEHGCCWECGAPWRRVVEPTEEYAKALGSDWSDKARDAEEGRGHFALPDGSRSGQRGVKRGAASLTAAYRTTGWEPGCACGHEETVPATVLDPFGGSGTTALVAAKCGRNAIHIDQSKEYLELAKRRLRADQPGLML